MYARSMRTRITITLKKVKFSDGTKLKEDELSGLKIEIAKREVSSNSINPRGAIAYAKFDSIVLKGSKYIIKVMLPIWNKNASNTRSGSVKGYRKKKLAKSDIESVVKNEGGGYTIVFTGNYTGTYVTGSK